MSGDTVDYIQHLHDVGHPPSVWIVTLHIERPDVLAFEAEHEHEWPIEIS